MRVAYSSFKGSQISTTNNGMVSVTNSLEADIAGTDPIISIHVAAKNLPKLDIGSESDPLCVLFALNNGRYEEVDRTEVIWDNPNPNWVKTFKTMYVFETHQPLRFALYDCDSEKGSLENHDFIGFVDTTVQHLGSNLSQDLELPIKDKNGKDVKGKFVITAEQTTTSSSVVNFSITVENLRKLKLFSRNNPYLIISKPSESGRNLPVFRSEVVPKTSTCTFKRFSIPMNALCNGELQTPIVLSIFDYRSGKLDVLNGSTTLAVQTLMENQGTKFPLLDNRKEIGYIKINQIDIVQKPTFVDYLRSGLQLNLVTAIDFTASNRDPRDPQSLHHLNPNQLNQYENCILSVGNVLCPYDSDQQFPVFGFGGKINGILSHCFPLTFQPENPNVLGLDGILNAYRNSVSMVQLSGPTCFAPIIRAATELSHLSFQESHTYTILLIITDGVINDMVETIDAIVIATDAPLSIIIVGVGNADFSLMNQLDADETPLRSSNGIVMKRDIVQFVPFRSFLNSQGYSLAAEVLAEVPSQVDEFCRSHGFIPNI